MSDISHYFGGDLSFSANGDLLMTSDPDTETTQRLLRALMTARDAYIWELRFGAGLPQQIGLPTNITAVRNAIRAQVFADPGVAKVPEPSVTLTNRPDGTYIATIAYTSAATGNVVPLSFPLG
jgi:hypothetical protein